MSTTFTKKQEQRARARLGKRATKTKLPRFLKRNFPQVDDVVDSTERVEVLVRDADCTDGQRLEPTNCAMARAIKREYEADGAIIGMTFSYIVRGKKAVRFQTPASVSREIVSFDRHQDFQPGTYHLSAVSPSVRLGTVRPGRPSGSRKDRRMVHKATARVRVLDKGTTVA